MTKLRNLTALLLCCGLLFSLAGCGGQSKEQTWGASCNITLEGLPPEYEWLPQQLRDEIAFSISLTGTSNDQTYSAELTEENGFSAQVQMLPGSYTVSKVYVRKEGGLPIEASPQAESVVLVKDTQTPLVISVTTGQELISFLQQCEPTEEILAEASYARKIQYAGTVMDLSALSQQMSFSDAQTTQLMPGDTRYLVSDRDPSVRMIVKNTTDAPISAPQASCVGFSFVGCNAVLPKGLAVGLPLKEVAHAETGILGTPSYCEGTPLIGMGIDTTKLVYIDSESGDRITCQVNSSHEFIDQITYEFEQYQ